VELESEFEVQNTRDKLKLLLDRFEKSQREPSSNPYAKELSLRSLKNMINQLTEEIARFEARAKSASV
jgi:hypothetical protein